jgi:hypothetical protein
MWIWSVPAVQAEFDRERNIHVEFGKVHRNARCLFGNQKSAVQS